MPRHNVSHRPSRPTDPFIASVSAPSRRRAHPKVSRPGIARLGRAAACAIESLEDRWLLTSTLYIDYGDRFAGGILNTTVGAIDTTVSGSNPDIDGPVLSDSAGNNYAASTGVQITSFNTLYPGAAGATLRATMDAFVQRFYQGLDITVVDLTATAQTVNGNSVQAAASLAEISQTLGLNEGAAENNDSYVIVGQYIINGTDNPAIFASNGYGGLSTGTDIGGNNNNDGTALVLLIGSGDSATFNGPQIAHESGHAFGLRHVYRQNVGSPAPALSNTTATGAQYDRLHQSELMSYLGYNTQGGFNTFTRYPMMRGDGNTDANVLSSSPTPFDQMANDPNIGPSGTEYVTGTGENDIISVTNAGGGLANVSIQAFDDAAYTVAVDAPGATGNTYSYQIALNKPLIIDAGGRNDRVVLDSDLGINITVRGMQGTDTLVVNGKNAASATYTSGTNNTNGLDGNSDRRGSMVIGGTTINFQEFEATSSVSVQNVGTLTFATGGSSDSVTFDSPAAGQNRITGTSDGVGIVPLLFSNVTNFAIDTATNDGGVPSDQVNLAATGLATGLQKLSVNTGAGNDTLDVNFAPGNPIPVNGLSFDGGTGTNDLLSLRGGTFTTETYLATGPGSGTIDLDGSLITYSNLAPINDTNVAANLIFTATAGADQINFVDGPVVNAFQTDQISSGNSTFERLNFANKTNVTINGADGADTLTLSATTAAAGLTTLAFNGGAAADSFAVNATLAGISYTLNGGLGDDTFNVTGSALALGSTLALNGDAGDDTFNVTSSPDVAINVNGGAATLGDTLNVDGETLDYTISATAFTAAGRQPINYTDVETLGLTNGTFQVPGTISPNVNINTGATLYGDGTVLGRVTGNTGGTLAPGSTLTVSTAIFNTGGLTLNAGSTYAVDLNGLTAGTLYDQTNVTGTVVLNGADLTGTLGFTSIPGDELVIIRNDGTDAVVGTFAAGSLVTIGGQKFAIDYAFDADGDLAFNDVALIRYGAALAPDPCDPSKQALYVSATTGNDEIRFVPAPGNSGVQVLINGNDEGTFRPDGLLIGFGQSGDDLISVDMPARAAMLYGGVGNDTLVAGNQHSVLVGGFGNDHLLGGGGKDILIGSAGADTLEGGNGGDLLIAGSTAYDGTQAASRAILCQVRDDWARSGKNVGDVFNSSTLFDDSDVDQLLGQNGQDTFFLNTTGGSAIDQSDAGKNETVIDLV